MRSSCVSHRFQHRAATALASFPFTRHILDESPNERLPWNEHCMQRKKLLFRSAQLGRVSSVGLAFRLHSVIRSLVWYVSYSQASEAEDGPRP